MSIAVATPMILVAGSACLTAAWTDLRSYRVPNWLTLSLVASGLLVRSISGGLPGLGDSLAGLAFGFVALIWVHALGGMGAGDVKLASGVGAWLGLALTARVLFFAALSGGVAAIALAMATGRLLEVIGSVPFLGPRLLRVPEVDSKPRDALDEELRRPDRRARVIPFAVMIALGLVIAVATR